jgi:chromosome segregation ATPase
MEFNALAAKETSALLARVLSTASRESLQKVDALRSALDAAVKALEASVGSAPNVEEDVDELVKRLAKAATADADARLKHLSAEARKITDALRAELAEATAEKERVVTSLTAEKEKVVTSLNAEKEKLTALLTAEKEKLTASLKEARSDLESTRSQLQTEQKQATAFRRELSEVQAANKKLELAKAEAVAAREKHEKTAAALDGEIRAVRAQLDSARRDAARAETDMETAVAQKQKVADDLVAEKQKLEMAVNAANTQTQAAEAKLSAVTTLFKTSAARVQALEREQEQYAAALRDLEAKAAAGSDIDVSTQTAAMLDGLLGAFETLSTATTMSDVLATLGEQLAAEFPRVALFRVKGNRLEGAHQIGFDLTNDIGKVMIPLAMDSLITRAVTARQTERLSGDVDTSGLPFGGSPTFALAMPIVVDGDAIAVVYGDDFADSRTDVHGDEELKVKFAEALRQHTVALLLRMTAELKALAELRAYAGSLLSEIEQMYQSDVTGGSQGDELRKRLLANLEYARSIFNNRAQYESPAAATLLDAQLTSMMESDTSFGRDLKAVCNRRGSSNARAAEAS